MNNNFEDVMKSIDSKFDRFVETLNGFVKKVITEVGNLKSAIKSKKNTLERTVYPQNKENVENKNIDYVEEDECFYSVDLILWEVANFTD